jgi:hypothetical protein
VIGHSKDDTKTRVAQFDFFAAMQFCGVSILDRRSNLVSSLLKTFQRLIHDHG